MSPFTEGDFNVNFQLKRAFKTIKEGRDSIMSVHGY